MDEPIAQDERDHCSLFRNTFANIIIESCGYCIVNRMTVLRRIPVFAVAAALLVCTAGVTSGATDTPEDGWEQTEADDVIITIAVQENGTAVWTIEYHYRLHSTDRKRGFDRLRSEIAAERETYVAGVRTDISKTVQLAENQTRRRMSLSNVTVRTKRQSLPRDIGIVVHQFVWQGFAEAGQTRIRVGDAIRGFYIGPRTELRIQWPSGYSASHVEDSADEMHDGEAVWTHGKFNVDGPPLVFEQTSDRPPLTLISAAFALVIVGGGIVAFGRRNYGRLRRVLSRNGDSTTNVPPEPLSDEERVKWVLEAHGGRVKQQTLADECGWGESKTSKVVRGLHDEDEIERFRLGRENVISLPEVNDSE